MSNKIIILTLQGYFFNDEETMQAEKLSNSFFRSSETWRNRSVSWQRLTADGIDVAPEEIPAAVSAGKTIQISYENWDGIVTRYFLSKSRWNSIDASKKYWRDSIGEEYVERYFSLD